MVAAVVVVFMDVVTSCHHCGTKTTIVTVLLLYSQLRHFRNVSCKLGSAGLKMSIYAPGSCRAILTYKAEQTDLILGIPSRFVGGSVCARLQVSVCSSYDVFYLG